MNRVTVAPGQAGSHAEPADTQLTHFGQLPAVHLKSPDGAEAIITLYGAHVVSWKDSSGQQRMFVSRKSTLDGSKAIRGGIPVIFPQFAARGTGMRHGFARVLPWRVTSMDLDGGAAFAVFTLADTDLPQEFAAAWPYAFELVLRVAVQANELAMSLEVRNRGAAPFPFAAALHTYHLVDDISKVAIEGVAPQVLSISDKLDQVFEAIGGTIGLHSGLGTLRLEQTGFVDAVVWNPGAADTAALADMENDEYKRFVCIEPALLGPTTLDAGAAWRGEYLISSAG